MLSDSCFEFLSGVRTLAARLAEDVDHYSAEPFDYPPAMIDRLRTTCAAATTSDEDLVALLALAIGTMQHLDGSPAETA